jgi:hypothetical protein
MMMMNTIPFRVASYNSLGLSLDSFRMDKMNCWLLLSLLDCPIETMQEGVREQAEIAEGVVSSSLGCSF